MRFSRRGARYLPELDPETAERMFAGLPADDAPPGFAAVADLLAAAAATADDGPLRGEAAAMAAFRAEAVKSRTVTYERPTMSLHSFRGRVVIAAAAGLITLGGGVAAAATGSLPTPVQRVAHQVLGGIGVPPAVDDVAHVTVTHGDHDSTTVPTTVVIPPTTNSTEPAAVNTPDEQVVETTESNHGQTVAAAAHSAEPGPDHGAAVCAVASKGACQADDNRTPETTETTETPDSTSEGPDQHGSDHTPGAKQPNETRHGTTVSSDARSADSGPDHGPAVCAVASNGACPTTGDRGDGADGAAPTTVQPQD